MTHQEMIDVIQHHMNGGEVEVMRHDGWGQATAPCWNFHTFDYRKKPEPKTRLLTIKEIWGKTLITPSGKMGIVGLMNCEEDDDGEALILIQKKWRTLDMLHDHGWRIAGPDLCYETASSLEVSE